MSEKKYLQFRTAVDAAVDAEIDREQFRQHLQIAISAVQLEIETTDDDETRSRMKSVLKALQKMAALL